MSIARIALDVPLPKLFDYLCGPLPVAVGDRVVVPFGKRLLVGVVLEILDQSDVDTARLKSIASIREDAPRLPADWIALMHFLSGYYQHPLGETVLSALPPRLRSLSPLPRETLAFWTRTNLAPQADSLRQSHRRTLLEEFSALALGVPIAESTLIADDARRRAALRALAQDGWITRCAPPWATRFVPPHPLTATQESALEVIRAAAGQHQTFLLHGVTGSGKTEVYFQCIANLLAQGGQTLVLVPEIGLTPQLEARVRAAFPETALSVLHSGLEESARTSAWLRAARGESGIILGTRLAVLTPLPRLAMIIVDEEHDTSFKQHEGVRYSARDAAIFRAQQSRVPVLLGTATPSLESYANAINGRYKLIELRERASPGAQLPRVHTIDMRTAVQSHGLAQTLQDALAARLARGEQSLLFINRRGYAPVLACGACGWNAACVRCSTRLVMHRADQRLRCHHCGLEEPIPAACPTCGNVDLEPLGRGTQRVEETLASHFPHARLVRIDRDTARGKSLISTLDDVRAGGADILIGTQLIAKGHDFPQLTFVGVLNADHALLSTDYRAAERLFATLMQVAGRAGRRETLGEVMIQTRYPEHPLYRALARHDYAGFARSQLAERQAAGFPPSVFEAALRAEAPRLVDALAFLRRAAELVEPPNGVQLFDPVPHVITRRANKERAQLVVQSTARRALQGFLRQWNAAIHEDAPRGIRWHIDVDPIEFD